MDKSRSFTEVLVRPGGLLSPRERFPRADAAAILKLLGRLEQPLLSFGQPLPHFDDQVAAVVDVDLAAPGFSGRSDKDTPGVAAAEQGTGGDSQCLRALPYHNACLDATAVAQRAGGLDKESP